MNELFALISQNWADFRPIFVGNIPAGEYTSEILHLELFEDATPAYLSIFYRFSNDTGTFDLSVRYYDGGRWWQALSRTLASYGLRSVEDAVGLKEIVTISEPAGGGRYMEITSRRKADSSIKKALPHVKPPLGTVSSKPKEKTKPRVEDVDDEFENELDDDFLDEDDD